MRDAESVTASSSTILNFVSCLWFLECSLFEQNENLFEMKCFSSVICEFGCVCVCMSDSHSHGAAYFHVIHQTNCKFIPSSVHGYSCLAKIQTSKKSKCRLLQKANKIVRHTDILKTCVKNVRQNLMKMYWYVFGK